MKTFARMLFALFLLSWLAGCVAMPVQLTTGEASVIVYRTPPDCEYQYIGMVNAISGSVGMDVEGNEPATLSKLKKNAYMMGATAVILRESGFGRRQWHSSGIVHRMSGDAIRGCKLNASEG